MMRIVYSLQSTVLSKRGICRMSVHRSRFTVHGDSGLLQSSAFRTRGFCRASVHGSRFTVHGDSEVIRCCR